MYRFFAEEDFQLSDDELHHAIHVLRVKPGEEIEIVNGKGTLARALFQKEILSVTETLPPKHKRILMQAYPQASHLECLIEKGTELGITDFYLFPSEKSPYKSLSDAKKERLKKITISALKQCKRLFLPTLSYFAKIPEIPSNALLADPRGEPFIKIQGDAAFIVGPESGFTPSEIDLFKKKAKPVKLSENILRCETAAITASAFLCST